MGLTSSSIEILPVIVVSCYYSQVSQKTPEHLNNPFTEGEQMRTTTMKKSFLLGEVSTVCVCGRVWGACWSLPN